MKRQIGNHLARREAAKTEPSPITALRDLLATAFAADVAAITPMVCDVLREGISESAVPARRDLIRRAHQTLVSKAGALPMDVAQEFRARFDMRLQAATGSVSGRNRPDGANLALMDETLLELDIALDQCAARLREQTSVEMFQLTARVSAMLGKSSLEDAENPIAPRVFACTLMDALGKMDFGSEQCLAVFKAFGPPMLYIASDLYNHANALLAECGVLPEFKARYGDPLSQPALPARRPEPVLPDERTLAAVLDRLLQGHRARGDGLAGVAL